MSPRPTDPSSASIAVLSPGPCRARSVDESCSSLRGPVYRPCDSREHGECSYEGNLFLHNNLPVCRSSLLLRDTVVFYVVSFRPCLCRFDYLLCRFDIRRRNARLRLGYVMRRRVRACARSEPGSPRFNCRPREGRSSLLAKGVPWALLWPTSTRSGDVGALCWKDCPRWSTLERRPGRRSSRRRPISNESSEEKCVQVSYNCCWQCWCRLHIITLHCVCLQTRSIVRDRTPSILT